MLLVDLNDAEAEKVLATFDPLAAMAEPDEAHLEALLKGIEADSEALAAMLEQLALASAAGSAARTHRRNRGHIIALARGGGQAVGRLRCCSRPE